MTGGTDSFDNVSTRPGPDVHVCGLFSPDPRQERIFLRLRDLVGAGPATFFYDACRLMSGGCELDSKTHLVGHLAREIESSLRGVLSSLTAETVTGQGTEAGKNRVCGKGTHRASVIEILRALDVEEDNPVAKVWLRMAQQDDKWALYRLAHRQDLNLRKLDSEFQQWWEDWQSLLDVVLQKFEEKYANVFSILDGLLASKDVNVSAFKNRVPNTVVTHKYFFSRLNNPQWIRKLLDGGIFDYPPDPENLDEGAGVRFPPWPVLGYLERMAKQYPEAHQDVLAAVHSVPFTANVRVHAGLLRVALALPANLSKGLISKAIEWLSGPYRPLSGIEYGELVAHVAAGGAPDEALGLARALFAVSTDMSATGFQAVPERISHWDYQEALKLVIPALAEAAPLDTLNLMADLLERAIAATIPMKDGSEAQSRVVDSSLFWRPAIEDHDQNDPEDLRSMLAAAVRDVALCAASRESITEVVELLGKRKYFVFQRIALHLLRVHGIDAPDLVRAHLLDRSLFDDPHVLHEYYHLLRDCFGLLSTGDQALIQATSSSADGVERERAAVPEIWPVLERHLDTRQDASLAVRSVYGQWFPWIHLLGSEWANSQVEAIFPRASEQEPWWTAAWVGYVIRSRPFDNILPVLRPVYEHAVNRMNPGEKLSSSEDEACIRLGEHLVTYAWRGVISLNPVESLLDQYWAKADAKLRRRVLTYVGRSLRDWPPAHLDPSMPPVIERLKLLWAFVVSRVGEAENDDQGSELSAFTWWFASGQFDDDWAFDQLDLVLQKASLLNGAHLVVERLVQTVDREPLRSVRALDKLVQSDRDGWRIIAWKDSTRKILEKALESKDTETRRACVALANRLVSKGYLEFRDLAGDLADLSQTAVGGEQTQ